MHPHAQRDFDLLSAKFCRVQADYERARSRGDVERIYQFRIQMGAITAERDRLMRHLSPLARGSAPLPRR
jgi:hypothetical protein